MFNEILCAGLENWKASLEWIFWNLLGSLLPVWGGVVFFALVSNEITFKAFSNNGQFAIYSAAMLTSAAFLVLKDYKTSTFSGRKLFGFLCLTALVLTTLIFVTVAAADTGQFYSDINRNFMRSASVTIYIISIVLMFFIIAIDQQKMQIDIDEIKKKGIQDLEKNFDELE